MPSILRTVLTAAPEPVATASARSFWDALWERGDVAAASPFELAVLGGFHADRVGFAFLAGYEGALRALFTLDHGVLGSFSVTEAGGNKPRAVQTRLDPVAGGFELEGEKRWATLAPIGDVLFVIARAGAAADGRPELRAVRLAGTASGLDVTALPETPFTPEVPHASLTMTHVAVDPDAVLPGDAYTAYVKPFRTAEDLHVHGGLLGYLIGAARRFDWPRATVEGLLASLSAASAPAR